MIKISRIFLKRKSKQKRVVRIFDKKTNSVPVNHSDVKSEDTIKESKIKRPKSNSPFLHME